MTLDCRWRWVRKKVSVLSLVMSGGCTYETPWTVSLSLECTEKQATQEERERKKENNK